MWSQRIWSRGAKSFTNATTLSLRQFQQHSRFSTNSYSKLSTPLTLGFLGFLFGSVDYDAVRKDIADSLDDYDWDDGSWGPVLIRLAWHASGTYSKKEGNGGSDGSTMRFKPELSDGANAGLEHAQKKLESIKEKYSNLSYADLWVLASYVAIEEMGGPRIEFKGGRKDASNESSCPPNGRLPDAALGAQHVRDVFYRMGFNDREIVALVGGGHAIGRCHTDRSGFDGPWTFAPTTISNEFFKVLFDEQWVERQWNGPKQFTDKRTTKLMMLPTDMTMKTDPEFRKYSEMYYKDESLFMKDFATAFKKLTELGFA